MQCAFCGQENTPDARICSRCNASLPVTPLPVPKIGVDESYSHGWKPLWKHFWILLLVGIIYFAISLVPSVFDPRLHALISPGGTSDTTFVYVIFSWVYYLLIVYPVSYGFLFAYLKAVRNDQLEVKDMFEVFRNYWSAVISNLLVFIIVLVGLIFLIVPGIIFGCRLAFVPFLVVDRKMGAIDSIKESWRMTRGHAGKVFLIGLLGILISIVGLLCLIIGIIPASMWIYSAFASLYYAISSKRQVSVQPETSTTQTSPISH